jgi:hypothetical protein
MLALPPTFPLIGRKTLSSDNLGRMVKWQDADGGWRTGRMVTLPRPYNNSPVAWSCDFFLVRESCDGRLTWVQRELLQDWPLRSEWEQPELALRDY